MKTGRQCCQEQEGQTFSPGNISFWGNFVLLFNWSIIFAVTSIAIIVMLYCASCCIEFKSHSLKRWPEYIMSRAAFSNIFHHLPSSLPSSRIADGKYWYFIFLMTWMYYEGQGGKGGWGLEIVANHKKLGAAHRQYRTGCRPVANIFIQNWTFSPN